MSLFAEAQLTSKIVHAPFYKYHVGDNLAWAQPGFDDSEWERVKDGNLPSTGFPTIGWLRLVFEVDKSLENRPLGLLVRHVGAVEFYLDGELVYESGKVGTSAENEVARISPNPKPEVIVLKNTTGDQNPSQHVAAIRLSTFSFQKPIWKDIELKIMWGIDEFARLNDSRNEIIRKATFHRIFLSGIILAFALMHLLLFLFYPPRRENLYYSIFAFSVAAVIFCRFADYFSSDPTYLLYNYRLLWFAVVPMALAWLRFTYSLFYRQRPKIFLVFCLAGMCLFVWAWNRPLSRTYPPLFILTVVLEVGRTIFASFIIKHNKQPQGSWIIGIGTMPLVFAGIYEALEGLRVVPELWDLIEFPLIFYTILVMAISVSVYLARDFAKTNRRLEEYSQTLEQRVEERTRELQKKQAQLVQSAKMASLGNLVAGVAHEVNNPIGAINSATDVLNRGMDKIAAQLKTTQLKENRALTRTLTLLKDNSKLISVACEQVTAIVQSLKDFARLDEAEYQKADLHQGLDSTLALLAHELRHKIKVVREYGPIGEIDCFPNQLNQVFMNLLVNAIEAIEGEGTITIKTFATDGKVYVQITDTGIGIPREHIRGIFDPGFTTKGVGVGTGLGLSISHNIIQQHNGDITVESQPGEGTTFLIRISDSRDNG